MKPAVVNYRHIVYAARIECTNGLTVRIVEYPYDIEMGGEVYVSDTGYQFTGIQSGTTMAPGVIDLRSFIGLSDDITLGTIASGIFDLAKVYIFATDWSAPVEDQEPIAKCLMGKVRTEDGAYVAEIMTLIDLLNTSIGDTYSALCSLVFGGQGHAQCNVDAVALQVTGTLTGATDNYTFTDSGRTEAEDYFGAGRIWFTTGANEGVKPQRVKAFDAGVIECNEPFPYPPEVGDEYVMEPGCRKRLTDCRDKWNNVLRRRAFDWIPGTRFLNRVGGE